MSRRGEPRSLRGKLIRSLLCLAPAGAACLGATCLPSPPPAADSVVGSAGAPLAQDALRAVEPTVPPAPPSQPPAPQGPLKLGVESAILMAIGNNQSLRVERLNPPMFRTFEEQERAAFDPVLDAQVSYSRTRSERRSPYGGGTTSSVSQDLAAQLGLTQFFPTGTTVGLTGTTDISRSSLYSDRFATSRVGLSLTQALLQGFGTGVNLVALRQARLDTQVSEYELRGFAQDLVATAEETYWDYALAERNILIFEDSLKLAEQQLNETQERIRIGKLAETELAAAQAEVALRRENLINARSTLAQTRLRLLRLLNPPGAGLWDREIVLEKQPAIPEAALDSVEAHVAVALQMRPEINEARLRILRGDLELVRTRNGLLPRLDLFLNLGKSGYADSFGRSADQVHEGKSYDYQAGLTFEYPLGDRAPRARNDRAILGYRQSLESVGNLVQLVQVDVRSAYIEISRAREQVTATAATRKFQEEALRAETEKFRVGKSTSFLVAQAQRDLVVSQISEVQAVVTLLKDLVELYRLEGSLLERRGIQAPGRQPVTLPSSRQGL